MCRVMTLFIFRPFSIFFRNRVFWLDLGKSSTNWFFEAYGWIRMKKLVWTLPFQGGWQEHCPSYSHLSFKTQPFDPNLDWVLSGAQNRLPGQGFCSKIIRNNWNRIQDVGGSSAWQSHPHASWLKKLQILDSIANLPETFGIESLACLEGDSGKYSVQV